MMKKSVLFAHNNEGFINKVNQYFQDEDLYSLNHYVLDGEALLNLVNLDRFDVVIVKNALTYITGLYALESLLLKTRHKPEIIILITPFVNDFIRDKCQQLQIYYVHNLNMSIRDIYHLLCQLEIERKVIGKKYFEPQIEIINLLKQIGLLKTYIGYKYFEYVLNSMLENSENINKYMINIYKMVGKHFNVSPCSVEKAMRLCIKSSFSKSDNFYAKILFGHYHNSYPSVSTFLQVCIKTLKEQKDYIIRHNIKQSLRKI